MSTGKKDNPCLLIMISYIIYALLDTSRNLLQRVVVNNIIRTMHDNKRVSFTVKFSLLQYPFIIGKARNAGNTTISDFIAAKLLNVPLIKLRMPYQTY